MHRVLIPVVGSANDDVAIDRVVTKFTQDETLEVHLLSVQAPMSRHVARLLRSGDPAKVQRDESEKALQRSKRLLEEHRIPYCAHVCKGDRAQLIVDEARRLECDRILMSAARKKSLTRMVQDATTNKVLQLSSVPVEIVAGDEISGLERYGVPVVLVAALAILVAAAVL
ncbi:MAG TPA: universal stress protein [Casimicrobiaceae bacterium]|nr:universal stress protein [Casimicrobiaceae bacterium]